MSGVYWVGNLPFANKISALRHATTTHQSVTWDYHDSTFGAIDWRVPIETPLTALYKQRAQQLRDKHEFLSLCYSGGADSTNVLHSFIDNGIFLDEIVMFRPSKFHPSRTLMTADNIWSEIDYAAIPHLNDHVDTGKTIVRVIDLNEVMQQFVQSHEAVDSLRGVKYLNATSVVKNVVFSQDPTWNARLVAGKSICHIVGMDKPVLMADSGEYYFQFVDSSGAGSGITNSGSMLEMLTKQVVEPFYWTPDLPELVIKQCQVVKAAATTNYLLQVLLANSHNTSQDYLRALDHIVYSPIVNSAAERFRVKKPPLVVPCSTDWLYECQNKTVVTDVVSGILNDVRTSVADTFFVTGTSYYNAPSSSPLPTEKRALKFFKNNQRYYV